eukprot:Gb_29473 [translate_table: standard]
MASMKLGSKADGFHRKGQAWFCSTGLPSDIIIEVEGMSFHLHKFPLLSKCGKIAKVLEECQDNGSSTSHVQLPNFPGGPNAFELAAKFCYGVRVELSPSNIGIVRCAAEYLEMTEEYGEENLQPKAESFLHKVVLQNWKYCIQALQNCESVLAKAEELQIVKKCVNAIAVMACTDPSLFGWPMMMYGSLQSPGGSILWNGINTGARVRSSHSDWWYEDLSYLSVPLLERVIKAMETRGIRSENIAGAVIHYAKKYLPGLSRWQGGHGSNIRGTIVHLGNAPAVADQNLLLESIERLLPVKKGMASCRFLSGMLRIAMILNVSQACKDSLERRIGMQLELSTLDGLLIPNYSDSVETLYDTDCMQRIIHYFLSFDQERVPVSPLPSMEADSIVGSPSLGPLTKVAKLTDDYLAEVAPDVNLKPSKFQSLAESLPAYSRSLDDGLYRALDIYLKSHPWLLESEKEQLCRIISCQKLSIDACTHAAQNERLPLRIVVQVLFFEQLQLRTAIAGCFHVAENDNTAIIARSNPLGEGTLTGPVLHRDGWATVVRENQFLKVDMDKMKSRVVELEQECTSIKHDIEKLGKLRGAFNSLCLISKKIGYKLGLRANNMQLSTAENENLKRRQQVEQAPPRQSKHRRSFSLF